MLDLLSIDSAFSTSYKQFSHNTALKLSNLVVTHQQAATVGLILTSHVLDYEKGYIYLI